MDFQLILTFVVVVGLIIGLIKDIAPASALFFVSISILFLGNVISPQDVLSGFSNDQIAVVILLLIIGNVINQTSIVPTIFDRIFKGSKTYKSFLLRLTIASSSMSAFLNNTPLVAMLIPYVYKWGINNKVSPSKLLIPLSYATIAGGMITLVGTSTNLIINGLAKEEGLRSLGMFEFAAAGITVAILVVVYMLTIGAKLLPDNKDVLTSVNENSKEYTIETELVKGGKLIGKNIENAGLRNLRGLFLIEIIRSGERLTPVSPEEILQESDKLIFAGNISTVTDLIHTDNGLRIPVEKDFNQSTDLDIVECVLANNSTLKGRKVKNSNFRSNFDASIVAIHRNGQRIEGKLGDVELSSGDVLLLAIGSDFYKRLEENSDLYIISKEKRRAELPKWKSILIVTMFVAAIALAGLDLFSLFKSSLIIMASLFLFKISSFKDIKRGLDIELVLVLGFSIALGKAIKASGAADLLATNIIDVFKQTGIVGIMFGIWLMTNILTAFMSNAAAAAIAFPIAVSLAHQMGVDPIPFVFCVAFGASLEFSTPIGYQTNMMIYGPGGYKFMDYVRVGVPLNLAAGFIAVIILAFQFHLI